MGRGRRHLGLAGTSVKPRVKSLSVTDFTGLTDSLQITVSKLRRVMARKSTRVFLFLTEQQVGQLLETIVTFLVLYVLAITFTILLLLSIGRSRCNASVVPVFSNSSKLTTIDSPKTASGKPESCLTHYFPNLFNLDAWRAME